MTKRFRRGLVVGKFSPLHLGHERLIGAAAAACERTFVISYSEPELPRCDADARERWLSLRCPQVEALVVDAARLAVLCARRGLPPRDVPHNDADAEVHRGFCAWLLAEHFGHTVDAVFTSEDYGDGFADSLTRRFRAVDPAHAAVVHVAVDPQRVVVPVSGTRIRADAAAHRAFVSAEVWADLVPRLCLLGGESSGKTTLARALAGRLGTAWVAEYGRERWEQVGGILSLDELEAIGATQVERERAAAAAATGWLVCDTSPLTTLVYALLDHGDATERLRRLARRRYDLVVVCESDFAFEQDGTRRDPAFAARQRDLAVSLLEAAGMPHVRVGGSIDQRVSAVIAHMGAAVVPDLSS